MALEFLVIPPCIATAGRELTLEEWVWLYHGTDIRSAESIQTHGLSAAASLTLSGGSAAFWMSDRIATASVYAQAHRDRGEELVVLGFQLPATLISTCVTASPPALWLTPEDEEWKFEFWPESFDLVNSHLMSSETSSLRLFRVD